MIKIGMMLGDRYEILEKIGQGGMSDVYKAKCHKLNRYVAVKVLKQEFSENANFVSKFRTEAQAAAGLMHPNIVNVYDVGEEQGIYYIVMELVEGITLKKYIERKARLSYKEAVSIAIQVSMGIEAAHNNHIIHRDIKPQNIIISKEGKVKVTDFGIAKAATSNTITSNVMGSVHYTSPEQARGGYSDEKSDIYSLGITMFEMLTGRVPFNGETTVAIAIKHIQEEMPSPREFVSEVPVAVESIVLKCCQKSPDRRYQSMPELVVDLKQALLSPDDDFVVRNDPEAEAGTRMITDSDVDQIKRHVRDDREYRGSSMRLRREIEDDRDYEDDDDYRDDDYHDEFDEGYNPRMERLTTILAVTGGILLLLVLVFFAIRIFNNMGGESSEPKSPVVVDEEENVSEDETQFEEVPILEGLTLKEARQKLTDRGLIPEVLYEESEEVEADVVMRSAVEPGISLARGSVVIITVSAGTQGIEIPEVLGYTYDEAVSKLTALKFYVNKSMANSDTVEEGIVINQVPETGTKVPEGSVITLTVSLGKGKVRVPQLIGETELDGTVMAIEAKLQVGSVAYVYDSDIAEGQICYQSYPAGSYVDPGLALDIKVSLGAEEVTYKCSTSVSAPSADEAPDYVSGSEVELSLVTDDGQVLYDSKTSSFPQAFNFDGLKSSGGTLTMTYTVKVQETSSDSQTGETVVGTGKTETRSFTRRIEFTRE